nr:class I SAM-dependent methyltransferase [Mesorhizobium sp.]
MADAVLGHALETAMGAGVDHLTDVISWHAHVPFANSLIELLVPRMVVELGVHKGDSLLSMAAAVQRFNQPGRVVGIDTWRGDDHAGVYDGKAVLDELMDRAANFGLRITLLRSTFDDALASFADGSIDLLHIDGLHTYEAVRHDFDSWRSKLSRRGVVLFHDIAVMRDDFGVHKFWEEVRGLGPSHGFTFGNGLGVLALGPDVPGEVVKLITSLARWPEVDRVFSAVGKAVESHSLARVMAARAEELERQVLGERQRAGAEIARLTAEMEAERGAAKGEFQRLQSELDDVRQTGVAEISRLSASLEEVRAAAQDAALLQARLEADRSAGRTEIDRLNREVAALHRDYSARLEAARLKRRAIRGIKRLALPVWRILPLPTMTKRRLRLAIVHRYGSALQLVPPKTPVLVTETHLSLHSQSGRYLSLARSATGVPSNLAPRSVSIVIPVYNQIEYTLRCIDAIKVNTADIEYEIIVVDDGSTDMTQAVLSARVDINYIRNEHNVGFIESCNVGLSRAANHYVCFLNNDTEVLSHWLSALVDTFELHPGVGLAGSQLIYPDGRLQEAGGIIWEDFSGWNWGRLEDPDNPRFNYARRADYISGAAVLLPRALAIAIGGFDPEFTPAYGEDSDMCFRLRTLGLSTVYQPLSRVIHYEGLSSGTDVTKGVKAYQAVNAEKLKQRWAHILPHHGANGLDPDRAVERGCLGRILVLDQITPEPDKDAGSITSLELMLALRNLGYKINFVPCSNFTYLTDYTDLLGGSGIESVLYPWAKSVDDHLRQVGDVYDAVVIFRVNTAVEHLDTVRKLAPRAKVIFHNSDLHFLREERARAVANTAIAERRLSSEDTKRTELAIIEKVDVSVVHSHFEADLLAESVPGAQVVVFPWVYEPRGPGPSFEDRADIVFLGGYRHYPNVDAFLHYVQDVDPLLHERLPGMKFHAIGSNPTREMKALTSSRIVIDGFVEDLLPVLNTARLMLVPLRYGAGLKGKIVTAMAHGLPVITTSVGAEGMALVDGEDVLVADTPQAIADAVTRVYTDPLLWKRLAQNGLSYVARTTSRYVGLKITRSILSSCGLPALPIPSKSPEDALFQALVGTPAQCYDLGLIAVAIRAVTKLDASVRLTFVTPKCSSIIVGDGAEEILELDSIGTALEPKGVWSLIMDACDDQAAGDVLSTLKSSWPGATPSAIVFLPPRVEYTGNDIRVTHAMSGRILAVGEAREPVHLRHGSALEATFGVVPTWLSDVSLLGFPSIQLALLRD